MNSSRRWVLRMIAALPALLTAAALAQEGQGDVVYVPTPQIVVDEMLKMAKVGPNDFLIDLGSGDGRIVITAAKRYGTRGFGVDLDTYLLKMANAGAQKEGVTDRVRFVEENLFETDLSQATVITSYLLPEMNAKLRPKILALPPGTRVVTHDYHMGEWDADQEKVLIVPEKTVGDPGKSYVYLYIVPAVVAGTWESQVAGGREKASYSFKFEQEFQEVSGVARVGGRDIRLPMFKLNGDQVAFTLTAPVKGKPVAHRFSGSIKGDTIEGTMTPVGAGQPPLPWTAKRTVRGKMRTGEDDVVAPGGK